ncbi:MAG TPA: Rrf2 family transcriptional regulator [Bryobacteraceae bacterium]|nr:Rrf2 family transcriptional regulator [Bryobacteraceae bacterium]
MLSQTAEYALRAMVTLAGAKGGARTAQDLARDSRVPIDYLSKVLNSLTRAGIVTSRRGRGGGFQSVQPATQLTVLQVVSAVDPLKRIKTCPLGLKAHGANLCPLHRKLDDAVRSVEDAFASTTIASLLGQSFPQTSFCEGENCDAAA